VRLVRELKQNDLPSQYRNGACPLLDLTGERSPVGTPTTPKPDGAVIAKPLSIFIGAFVLVVPLTLSIVY